MKKVISIILFVLSIIAALFDIFVCVYGLIDISNELAEIAKTHTHASGSDYLGVAIGVGIYAIGIFVTSLFGLIISGVNAAITEKKAFKYISIAMVCLFVLILMMLPAVATR